MSGWDVVVLGAGPAGAMVAREGAKAGASVLLVDRASFPRWKVCGGCLSPGAASALSQVGLGHLAQRLGGVPLDRLTLRAGKRSSPIELAGSTALSRSAFDHALVEAAIESGVDFRDGVRAQVGVRDGDRTTLSLTSRGVETSVTARVVVDATGLGGMIGSSENHIVGHGGPPSARVTPGIRIGLGAVFDDPLHEAEAGELQMTVGQAGYVGVVRVEDGTLTLGAALDPEVVRRFGPEGAVRQIFLETGRTPPQGVMREGWRGTPSLTYRRERLADIGFFRVGDAAGYVEPFTGEGMSWALNSALALAPLVVRASTGWSADYAVRWEAYHRRRMLPAQRLCRYLARGLRSPRLVRSAIGLLERAPGIARPFVHAAARHPFAEAAA